MKATNQGFIDLHSPLGVLLVGVSLILLTGIIIAGALVSRAMERENARKRAEMRKQLEESRK